MEDEKIIDLYWQRDQAAIHETDLKYGRQLQTLSFHILNNREDAEECVSDTYIAVWGSLPPCRPSRFQAFIAAILRNISLKRVRERSAKKRGGGQLDLALEELDECLGSGFCVEQEVEQKELTEKINQFLFSLSPDDRKIFMCRYWLLAPVNEVAARMGFSQSKVKSSLHRTRQKLQIYLRKEQLL